MFKAAYLVRRVFWPLFVFLTYNDITQFNDRFGVPLCVVHVLV